MNLTIRLRDWWRGFTNEDLVSALRKMELKHGTSGEIVWISNAEFRALSAWMRRHGCVHPIQTT